MLTRSRTMAAWDSKNGEG